LIVPQIFSQIAGRSADGQRRNTARMEMMTKKSAPLGATQASLASIGVNNNGCIIFLSFSTAIYLPLLGTAYK